MCQSKSPGDNGWLPHEAGCMRHKKKEKTQCPPKANPVTVSAQILARCVAESTVGKNNPKAAMKPAETHHARTTHTTPPPSHPPLHTPNAHNTHTHSKPQPPL